MAADGFVKQLREKFFDIHLNRSPTRERFHTPIEWKCFIEKEERAQGLAEMKHLVTKMRAANQVPPEGASLDGLSDVPVPFPFPEFTIEPVKPGVRERIVEFLGSTKKRLVSLFQKSNYSV